VLSARRLFAARRERLKKRGGQWVPPIVGDEESDAGRALLREHEGGDGLLEQEWATELARGDESAVSALRALQALRAEKVIPNEADEEAEAEAELEDVVPPAGLGWAGMFEGKRGSRSNDRKERRRRMISRAIEKEVTKALMSGDIAKQK